MYQLLKQLGMSDSKTASARECFTPNECELHFETITKHRSDESEETIQKALERIIDIKIVK